MIAARSIGPVRATFLVAGNMIGSGIYLLPATLGAVGSVSLIGWIASGFGAFVLGIVFALLVRLRPQSLGVVRQVTDGAGPFLGYQTALFYWISGWLGNVAVALTAIGYCAFFAPALRDAGAAALATIAITWLLTGLNFLGARRVSEFGGVTLAVGLAPVLVVALFGWFAFSPDTFAQSWNVSGRSDFAAVSATLLPIFFAFLGVECVAVAARVVRDPARDVPIATLGGVAIAAVIYIAATAALLGMMSAQELARSTAPFADAVALWVGPVAAAIVALCAIAKTSGTLAGWMLAIAEAAKAGADSGVLPAFFKEKDDGVPRRNLLIIAVLMTVVTVASSAPRLGDQFNLLASLATVLFLFIYVYCCAALWRFTKNVWARAAALFAAAFCIYAIIAAAADILVMTVIGFAMTIPLYLWMRRARPQAT